MKIIIFAGGTGKRFWPASRKKSPKQFLPIISNKPLIKIKYEYLRLGFKPEDIFVSTGIQYKKEVTKILDELPKDNFIFEPEMRDTGAAVTLAISYVSKKFPKEVISTQWSDHLIKKPKVFIKALKETEKYILKDRAKYILIGVPARFPSPHRGYIKVRNELEKINKDISLRKFIAFKEKPDLELAKEYIKSKNYAWNPGYWSMKGIDYLNIVKKTAPDIYNVCQEIVNNNFSEDSLDKFKTLEKIAADYIFAEHLKLKDTLVTLSDMGWSDVGEWIAFKEAFESNNNSNVSIGNTFDYNSSDTLIYNQEKEKLVATIGLKGFVVVNTKDVLAIFHKDDNTKIKEFLNKLEENDLSKYL